MVALRFCILVCASTEQFPNQSVFNKTVSFTFSNVQSMFFILLSRVCFSSLYLGPWRTYWELDSTSKSQLQTGLLVEPFKVTIFDCIKKTTFIIATTQVMIAKKFKIPRKTISISTGKVIPQIQSLSNVTYFIRKQVKEKWVLIILYLRVEKKWINI